MNLPEEHRKETYTKIKNVDKGKIAEWLLHYGYYPEQYVLPPCFTIKNFGLNENRYFEERNNNGNYKVESKKLVKINFPKTDLAEREFAVMHPYHYHDLVWELFSNWDDLLEHLFNEDNKIYSYSFPIPINEETETKKQLRSGRMIYEFLEMAEKDLVAEAHKYSQIVRLDITNFYPSVYTHTLCWAWEGRDGKNQGRQKCSGDQSDKKFGNRLDRLFQYANDRRTVGIPVGSVISDLMAEMILTERDINISQQLENDKNLKGKFLATRFKDDYRILCKSKSDGKRIIKVIIEVLKEFNLVVNEKKTEIIELPDGLYRPHTVFYEPYSFRNPKNLNNDKIHFKSFENVLLRTLQLHRDYPGTSIIEKFLSELILSKRTKDRDGQCKVNSVADRFLLDFGDTSKATGIKKIKKAVSLLLMLKNESSKSLGKVLSILEHILLFGEIDWFREYVTIQIKSEIKQAITKESPFELNWFLYFICRHNLEIDLRVIYKEMRDDDVHNKTLGNCGLLENRFIATLRGKRAGKGNIENPFEEDLNGILLFESPENLIDTYLIEYLDIFDRDKDSINEEG